MKIALLPLDGRPANADLPVRLGRLVGVEVDTPPRELLGFRERPADAAGLLDWTLRHAKVADATILSLDLWVHGGLVPSQLEITPVEEVQRRFDGLAAVREVTRGRPLLAYGLVPRLAPETLSDADAGELDALERLLPLRDRLRAREDPAVRRELEALAAKVPPPRREAAERVRLRNHAVNQAAIEMRKQGWFDGLFFFQDDAAPHGPHRNEQAELLRKAVDAGLGGGIPVAPGGESAALLLLVRLLARGWNIEPILRIVYADEADKGRTPPDADRTLEEGVRTGLALLGAREPAGDEEGVTVYVNPPGAGAGAAAPGRDADPRVRWIKTSLEKGRAVVVADLGRPGGADAAFLQALHFPVDLFALAGYAGGGASLDVLGGALAQAAVADIGRRAGSLDAHARGEFLSMRWLDDWFYRAELRGAFEKERRGRNLPVADMGGDADATADRATRVLQAMWGQRFPDRPFAFRAAFPWRRLQEIEIVPGA